MPCRHVLWPGIGTVGINYLPLPGACQPPLRAVAAIYYFNGLTRDPCCEFLVTATVSAVAAAKSTKIYKSMKTPKQLVHLYGMNGLLLAVASPCDSVTLQLLGQLVCWAAGLRHIIQNNSFLGCCVSSTASKLRRESISRGSSIRQLCNT
jgi:hypothetical protein